MYHAIETLTPIPFEPTIRSIASVLFISVPHDPLLATLHRDCGTTLFRHPPSCPLGGVSYSLTAVRALMYSIDNDRPVNLMQVPIRYTKG